MWIMATDVRFSYPVRPVSITGGKWCIRVISGNDDIGQMLVYLRDAADYAVVREMFDQRFPEMPKVILLAPVCRPGWLIEMECMGTKMMKHTPYPDF